MADIKPFKCLRSSLLWFFFSTVSNSQKQIGSLNRERRKKNIVQTLFPSLMVFKCVCLYYFSLQLAAMTLNKPPNLLMLTWRDVELMWARYLACWSHTHAHIQSVPHIYSLLESSELNNQPSSMNLRAKTFNHHHQGSSSTDQRWLDSYPVSSANASHLFWYTCWGSHDR